MVEIKRIKELSPEGYSFISNYTYTSGSKFEITRQTETNEISFTLKYAELEVPFFKNLKISPDALADLIHEGNSYAAYEGKALTGIIISERREWNNSLWIELIKVADSHKNKGTGSELLRAVEQHAVLNKFRLIEIETQNTNVPAINFYRKNGYEFAGVNLTLYDSDKIKNETAVFMSKVPKAD